MVEQIKHSQIQQQLLHQILEHYLMAIRYQLLHRILERHLMAAIRWQLLHRILEHYLMAAIRWQLLYRILYQILVQIKLNLLTALVTATYHLVSYVVVLQPQPPL